MSNVTKSSFDRHNEYLRSQRRVQFVEKCVIVLCAMVVGSILLICGIQIGIAKGRVLGFESAIQQCHTCCISHDVQTE
jgi:hypothetical protein